MSEYRVQVYIRRRGQTIADGNEFKTENFDDSDELDYAISNFVRETISELEDGGDDEDDESTVN